MNKNCMKTKQMRLLIRKWKRWTFSRSVEKQKKLNLH